MSCNICHETTHVTSSHQCPTCHDHGHGEEQCGDDAQIEELKQYQNDKLLNEKHCDFLRCRFRSSHDYTQHKCRACGGNHSYCGESKSYCYVADCTSPASHVTTAHKCSCGEFGHGEYECKDVEKKNKLDDHENDIMPNNKRCRQPKCGYRDSHMSGYHSCRSCGGNHSDCKKKAVGLSWTVKCPMCRDQIAVPVNQKNIVKPSEQCCICLDGKANVFFNCGHTCVCEGCFFKLAGGETSDIPPRCAKFAKKKFTDGRQYVQIATGEGCFLYIRRNGKDSPLEGFFLHVNNRGQRGVDDRPKLKLFLNNFNKVS